MVKTQKNVEYLKEIDEIKDFLKYTPKSKKSLKTYFSALDKFFPYLVNFYEIVEGFDLTEYLKKGINETNEIKEEWSKNNVVDRVFEEWTKINKGKRSGLFMKWVNEQNEDIRNTYLNYVWRIQGLFAQVSERWSANPKTIQKIKTNGIHVDEDKEIDLADVGELYNKLNPKYKMILKMMMYTGLNPADLVELKPVDFKKISNKEKYGDNVYYYVKKERKKEKHKNVIYLHVYTEFFMKEIKDYFEMKKTLKYSKIKQANKVEQLKKDTRVEVIKEYKNHIEFNSKRDWKEDQKECIFNGMKATAITDVFRYHSRDKKENRVQPATVRRLCFTRIGKIFSHAPKEIDIYNLWTQHKVGVVTDHYITDLIPSVISFLEEGKIQSAVLLGNMGDYIKESITLKKKIDDIEILKEENKELKEEMESMKHSLKTEIKEIYEKKIVELREELQSMFVERDYKKDLNQRVKQGEISEGKARTEYLGIEITEEEKHSKVKK